MAILNDDHLYAFGALTYEYARAESGIRICMAGLMRIDLNQMLVLTDPYSALNLRNVAKVVAKARIPEGPTRERFIELVGRLKSFGPIRNSIAHSRWSAGARPGSIKVLGIDIRSGSLKLLGSGDDNRDWLASEILECAHGLQPLNRDIVAFLEDTGLRALIENHTDETSSSKEER